MLTVENYRTLYQIKEGTWKIAKEYPELNLQYIQHILGNFSNLVHDGEKIRAGYPLNVDAIRLAWVLVYLEQEKRDMEGWALISTDQVGTYTFASVDGKEGFSLFVMNPYSSKKKPTVVPMYRDKSLVDNECGSIDEAIKRNHLADDTGHVLGSKAYA